jgi:hypothetical protein
MKPLHTSSTSAISLRTKLQATRSDNGGEYINAAVAKFKSGKALTLSPLSPTCPTPMALLRT